MVRRVEGRKRPGHVDQALGGRGKMKSY